MYEFNYQRPASVDDAVKLETEDSRFLAGGQSLVQSMKLRLASADNLIDLSGVPGLESIDVSGGSIRVGAMTTHNAVAQSADVQKTLPALATLASGIGDQMVRNMGTIGGSMANADPAACYPAAALALNATVHTNTRDVPADSFFTGLFETALEPGELLTGVTFQVPEAAAYVKFKQPASRFALVGVMVARFADGVRVGVTGAKDHAYRLADYEQALTADFAVSALDGKEVPDDGMNADIHASADYRAAMVGVMARRAVAAAGGKA